MPEKTLEQVIDDWTAKFVTRRTKMLQDYINDELTPEQAHQHSDNLYNLQIRNGDVALLKMMLMAEGYMLPEVPAPKPAELTAEDIRWLVEYGYTKDKRIVLPEVPGEADNRLDWVMRCMLEYLDETNYDRNRVEKTLWTRIKLISQLNLG